MAVNKKKTPPTKEELYEQADLFVKADSCITEKRYRVENYQTAARIFREAGDIKDAKERAEECERLAEQAKAEYLAEFYEEASSILNNAKTPEDYVEASRILVKIPGYKDADALLKKCSDKQEELAIKRVKRNRIIVGILAVVVAAVIIFSNTSLIDHLMGHVNPVDRGQSETEASDKNKEEKDKKEEKKDGKQELTIANAVPDNIIPFGSYEWKVIDRQDDEVLLLMQHAEKHAETRNGAYNKKLEDVTWADCSLREWLNGDFLKDGFSSKERDMILSLNYENPDNPEYGTDGGEDTEDKVTLLTPEMYEKYHGLVDNISMNFWLRAPGYTQQQAVFASQRKQVMPYGYAVDSDQLYVVPVIKVKVPASMNPIRYPEEAAAAETEFTIADAVPMNNVLFGIYEWKVIDRQDDELLLLMQHAEKYPETRNGAYNDTLEDVTWADCSLREWLNGEFFENSFSEEERSMILSEKYENPDNAEYGTDGGEDTEDKVTLLTPEMYDYYRELTDNISMNFWLRAPGYSQKEAQFVSHRKQIMPYGYAVDSDQFYVVPVIKIKVPASMNPIKYTAKPPEQKAEEQETDKEPDLRVGE